MNSTNIMALLALIASSSLFVWSADSKTIKSRDGICQVSVPADWSGGELPGMAASPDKQQSLVVSSPKMVDSFSELKQTARSVYKNSKVTKDSATEFEMEGQSTTGQPDVYRAIPAGGSKFCIVEVTYKSGTPEEARKTAQSLKSTK